MDMDPIAGNWPAAIQDYGFSKTKSDKEQLFVMLLVSFKNEQGESFTKQMTWYCQLTEKGTAVALNALVACGISNPDLAAVAKGVAGGALNLKSELTAVVEHNDDYGWQVRYLNGSGGVLGRMSHGDAVQSDNIASASVLLGQKLQGLKAQGGAKKGPEIEL